MPFKKGVKANSTCQGRRQNKANLPRGRVSGIRSQRSDTRFPIPGFSCETKPISDRVETKPVDEAAGSVRVKAYCGTGILPVSSMGVPPMNPRILHGQDARGTHGRDGRATGLSNAKGCVWEPMPMPRKRQTASLRTRRCFWWPNRVACDISTLWAVISSR